MARFVLGVVRVLAFVGWIGFRRVEPLRNWIDAAGDVYCVESDPPGSEELFLFITGILTLLIGDEVARRLDAGMYARLSTDRKYGYRNEGSEPVRFIRVAHVAS